MRYKGDIVNLCDKVRELVFNEETRIKFKDFKCDKIKIFKKFDKSEKYLQFMEKGYRPIYLVYTRKCDLINSTVRDIIFKGTKKNMGN